MGSDGPGKLAKATRGVKGDSAATERRRRGVRKANEKEARDGGNRSPRERERGSGRRKPSRASVTPRGFEPRLRPRERPSPGPLRRRGPSSRSQGERERGPGRRKPSRAS